MKNDAVQKIIDLIKKNGEAGATWLSEQLGISRQAVHRHLKTLEVTGQLRKEGVGGRTRYRLQAQQRDLTLDEIREEVKKALAPCSDVCLITLFGSQARDDAHEDSDVDLMVWLKSGTQENRQTIWKLWDQNTEHLWWTDRSSIVVKRLARKIYLHTLLLDLPEEHVALYDPDGMFPQLVSAIKKWREQNHAQKIPSFGGKHAWSYSDSAKSLSEIDFSIRLNHVA